VPVFRFVRYGDMSLGFIAGGIIACLFAIIALMPGFDGKWD
jgi:hypothetical protein